MVCRKNSRNVIDEKNIWIDDLFDRKIVADDFTKILTTITQPFVISVDAPYGSGKSFFLERWEKELSEDNITIFFNAWKCDFVKNPLIPFMFDFLSQLETKGLIKTKQKEDIKNALISIGKNIISTGTIGIIDPEAILNEQKYKTFGLSSTSLDEYEDIISNLRIFNKKVSKLIGDIKGDNKNIYVFVDELERCRPTFAVELLESIKHLFDIDGLVFILGIDRSQLKSTIGAIYGANMDGEGYLRRFIDLELNLPEPNRNEFIKMLCGQFEIKNKESKYIKTWAGGYDVFNEYFEMFSNTFNMSLREIEQCYTEFNIITKTIPENFINLMPLLAFLIAIKCKKLDLYNKLGTEYKDADFIVDYLNENISPSIKFDEYGTNERRWNNFLEIIMACFEKDFDSRLQAFDKKLDEIISNKGNTKELEQKRDIIIRVDKILSNIDSSYDVSRKDIFRLVKQKLSYNTLN